MKDPHYEVQIKSGLITDTTMLIHQAPEVKQELGVVLRIPVGEIDIRGLPTGKNVYWAMSKKELTIRIPLG